MIRNRLNRHSNFDLMSKVFWVIFALAITMIIAIWVTVGMGIYTLVTDPESVGNIAADVIRPVADAVKGE